MGTENKSDCYKDNARIPSANVLQLPKFQQNFLSAKATSITVGVDGVAEVDDGQKVHVLSGVSLNRNECSNQTVSLTPSFVPIHIGEDVIGGAKEILQIIRPHWKHSNVEFKKFTDGITNKLVGCFYNPPQPPKTIKNDNNIDTSSSNVREISITAITVSSEGLGDNNDDSGNISDTETADSGVSNCTNTNTKTGCRNKSIADSNVVLVRVYGNKTDLLIDRKAETRNIQLLQTYGFAPTIFAIFKNGIVYDFVPGVTLNTTSVLEPAVWPLVATRMAEMHRLVKVPGTDKPIVPMLWRKMQSFFDLVPERFSIPAKHKRVKDTFLPIKRLRHEFNSLYKHLERLKSPVVFAHNDLLLSNIVYLESKPCVNFIDFEYTDYNFQAFDIGNHFCEFAGVDEVDFSRYPNREFQFSWLRVYLKEYLQRSNVTDEEVDTLFLQVNQFSLSAHMFWTVWSLIQAEHSNIDFDYISYAHIRYKEYQKHRSKLALHTTEEKNVVRVS